MNCKQVEELLPLYTGRDLDERRERLIADHVRECPGCAAAASEFREARQLIGELVPPRFSENVYTGIRQEVWRKIEAESNAPSAWQLVPTWFWPPRVAWALATAVLVTVFLLAIYLMGNRQTTRPQVAGSGPETNQNRQTEQPGAQPKSSNAEVAPLPMTVGNKGAQQADPVQPPHRLVRKIRAERATSNAANSTAAQSTNVETSAQTDSQTQADSQAEAGATSPNSASPLRMEIQTKDPNIRIIWFAQQETKPTKGT
jgi:Putative zinc-finger